MSVGNYFLEYCLYDVAENFSVTALLTAIKKQFMMYRIQFEFELIRNTFITVNRNKH